MKRLASKKSQNSNSRTRVGLDHDTIALIESRKGKDESIEDTIKRVFSSPTQRIYRELTTKLLFIGPPGAGKSTIRSVFFEDTTPEHLIHENLEPTRGLEHFKYPWFGVNLALADSSGQEILDWFEDRKEEAFGGTDCIVFILDVARWDVDREDMLMYIYKTYLTKLLLESDAEIYIFLHKKDLIPKNTQEHKLVEIKTAIHNHLVSNDLTIKDVNCFYTSIADSEVHTIFRAMRKILSRTLKSLFRTISGAIPDYTDFVKAKVRQIVEKSKK